MSIFMLISFLAMATGITVAVTLTQKLFGRLDAIESGRSSGQLSDEVQRLRIEVGDLQSEVQSLNERLEFTEKLLAGPADANPMRTLSDGGSGASQD